MLGNSSFGFSGDGTGGVSPITGGGTLNYIAMFTPNGTSIGDSIMSQVNDPDDATINDIQIDGNFIPDSTLNARKLGASTRRWDTLYMASNIDYANDLLFNSGGNQYFRMSTTGDFFISDNKNIDVENTGSKTLNIGMQNAVVINIGTGLAQKTINVGSSTTLLDNINIYGNIFSQQVTNLLVKDKLFTVNDGGAIASGFNAGFTIQEGGVDTGWFMTNSTRDGWDFKSPSSSYYATITQNLLSANRIYEMPNLNGTFTVLGNTTTGSGSTLVLSTSPTFTTQINVNGLVNIIRTSEQLRVGYDTSNYVSHTVNSSGALTIASSDPTAAISLSNLLVINNVGYDNKLQFSRTGGNGYSFQHDAASLYLYNNTAAKAIFRAFNGGYTIFDTPVASTGNNVQYQFTSANSTGHTAGANIPNFRLLSATKTWSAGALPNQYFVHLASQTIAFASASTATNVYGLYVEAATAGTNATITNNYALGLNGNFDITIGAGRFTVKDFSGTQTALYMNNTTTAGATNYILLATNSNGTLNGRLNTSLAVGGTAYLNLNPAANNIMWAFSNANKTGSTASIELPYFKVTGASITWANEGAATTIPTQRWNWFTANTASTSGGGSLTITDSYGIYAEAATVSGVTITNNYAAGFGGNINIIGTPYISGVAGVDGTFTTADAKTVTVTKGIITSIV